MIKLQATNQKWLKTCVFRLINTKSTQPPLMCGVTAFCSSRFVAFQANKIHLRHFNIWICDVRFGAKLLCRMEHNGQTWMWWCRWIEELANTYLVSEIVPMIIAGRKWIPHPSTERLPEGHLRHHDWVLVKTCTKSILNRCSLSYFVDWRSVGIHSVGADHHSLALKTSLSWRKIYYSPQVCGHEWMFTSCLRKWFDV